jgi:high-affinity Fe2+/Pb2+ permease
MINKIKKYWLKLDPTQQYMVWIISFCLMLVACLIGLVVYEHFFTIDQSGLMLLMLGIGGFIAFFIFVVLYLTVYWPNHYKKNNKSNSKKD